ncbi:MAG: ribonuclease H-like domain containing nuclease [Candidatus Westeberhardia cardiocondylae]|nr:ribonuclease H-like domain containing nuclease [Candidatus Westeberhardia cardiocondylae]
MIVQHKLKFYCLYNFLHFMKKNVYFVAFDIGTKNIGIAISHYRIKIVHPIGVFKIFNGKPNWLIIQKFFNEWKFLKIIIGLPLNMNGTEQPFTLQVRNFSHQIQNRFSYPIIFHDERLSTFEAKSRLKNNNFCFIKKDNVDALSAAVILESWLYQQQK